MIRSIFFALLFLSSFLYANADECSVSVCEQSTGGTCKQSGNSVYSIEFVNTDEVDKDAMLKQCNSYYPDYSGYVKVEYKSGGGWLSGWYCFNQNGSYNGSFFPTVVYKKKEEQKLFCSSAEPEKPTVPESCSSGFCSGADAKRYYEATWYETGQGCSSQIVKKWSESEGTYKFIIRFSCESPNKQTDVCRFIADPPISCTDEESDNEDKPSVENPDPNVPCFGNVEDCNATTPPDYVDPETGIPCWGDKCGDVTPPDYVDPETGVPCWGDKCGISPPTGDGDGNGNGNDNGGDGPGQGGDGDQACHGDWCIDLPGDGSGGIGIPGGDAVKIPDSFWEKKDKETIKDKYKREIERKNPYDFESINTNIGTGSCPVWKFEYFGDLSPPCWFWDVLGKFFALLCTYSAFMIVFVRR